MAIDTHVWVWFHLGDARLNAEIAADIGPETVLSAVSVWEVMLLLEKGRLSSGFSPKVTVQKWIEAAPMRIVPAYAEIAVLARTLAFTHEDPADRFIAATSYQEGVPLATSDSRLLNLDWLVTRAA